MTQADWASADWPILLVVVMLTLWALVGVVVGAFIALAKWLEAS